MFVGARHRRTSPLTQDRTHMELSTEVLMDMHRRMVRIRLFEEAAGQLAESGQASRLPPPVRRPGGGRRRRLHNADRRRPDHLDPPRPRPPRRQGRRVQRPMMAELMGKSTGYNKGKGGSMHICDLDVGMLGANGIVGAGRADRRRCRLRPTSTRATATSPRPSSVTAPTNIGAFHEAANMACALKLPVVFVCENNEYGEFTPRDKTMAITDIVDRAAGYGMPGVIVDGMDVVAVHEAAGEAIDRARSRRGPVADRGEDLPLLQPPRRPEPRAEVPHRRRGRRVEAKQRSDLHLRGPDDRGRLRHVATTSTACGTNCAPTSTMAIQFAEDSPLPTPTRCSTGVYTGPPRR